MTASSNDYSETIEEQLATRVHWKFLKEFDLKRFTMEFTEEEKAQVRKRMEKMLNQTAQKEFNLSLEPQQRARLLDGLLDEIVGIGPLEVLMRDQSVTEIMVNGPREIYFERNGQLQRASIRFRDDNQMLYMIERMLSPLGRRVNYSEPHVDARLPDGSRLTVTLAPVAVGGPYVTIRKFGRHILSLPQLLELKTLTQPVAEFLRACVQARLNIVLSGASSAGKTVTLNVLSDLIPRDERIVIIEDTVEIQLNNHHTVRMEMRPPNLEGRLEITIRDLLRYALRMRPDRIIVGEVRGEEALDMLQAMNTGHDGSMTTLHANGPLEVLDRVETMALMSPLGLSPSAVERQVRSALDLIVHLQRWPDGSRRIVHIAEVRKGHHAAGDPLVDLFIMKRTAVGGELVSTGVRPNFLQQITEHGVELPPNLFTSPS